MGFWARASADPHWIAVVEPDGQELTAGDLLDRVNQLTLALRGLGLRPGDGIAALLPNGSAPLGLLLAATQAGWYFTPLNWHLTVPEIAYILGDCQAKAFFASSRFGGTAEAAADAAGLPGDARFCYGPVRGFTEVSELLAGQPVSSPPDRVAGAAMHYTSGTTGRPKGVRRTLTGADPDEASELTAALPRLFGVTDGQPNAHLMTSPNYHTAVTVFAGGALHIGHTIVCMDGWDSSAMLALTERYRITSTHMVPTQFKRLLSLPEKIRASRDLSSMRWMIHAAAPCPAAIKRAMLEWWGPVVYEYYAATEGGGTYTTPREWLERPGTVGKPWPTSEVIVVDDGGDPVPDGVPGLVYMRSALDFEYFRDPAKTAASRLGSFFTVGDIGFFDADGYLFLCDRKADMIISGGVNIYPAEVEAEIMAHPKVADVAVFGIPDEEWGEQIKAAVEPAPGVSPGPELAAEIMASLEGRLAKMKWPKTIDFVGELPRDPSGKLRKRLLRDPHWSGRPAPI